MSLGWIKLHRKIQNKGYYKKSQYVHLWIHLLLKANHSKAEMMWNNKIIIIKEGQLLTGRKQLAIETGINEGTIENILKMLENEHQILQQKTTKFRIITILNWHDHQNVDNKIDNRVTTELQQSYTNKNDKNEENDKKKEGEYFLGIFNTFLPPELQADWCALLDYYYERGDYRVTRSTIMAQAKYLRDNIKDAKRIMRETIKNNWKKLAEVKDGRTSSEIGAKPDELAGIVARRFNREQKEST